MPYVYWSSSPADRWSHISAIALPLLILKLRALLRMNFTTRGAREEILAILDTVYVR